MNIIMPGIEDAKRFSDFLKKTAGETIYLSFDVEEAPDSRACESMIRILSLGKSVLYLAETEGSIAGSITLRGRDNRKRLSHVGEIGIVVAKDYWGQGIGRLLLNKVIDHAKSVGIEKLSLKVLDDNKRAVTLYEKLGFTREGLLIDEVRIEGSNYSYIVMGLFI